MILGLYAGDFEENKKACDSKKSQACVKVGNYYVNKSYKVSLRESDAIWNKSIKYYKKACDLDNGEGCMELAYKHDNINANEHSLAAKYFTKSCKLQYAQGCEEMGFFYLRRTNKYDVAKKAYKIACTLGIKKRCYTEEEWFKEEIHFRAIKLM